MWRHDKFSKYLAAHEIAAGLGPEKSQALPVFHALTLYPALLAMGRRLHGLYGPSFQNLQMPC